MERNAHRETVGGKNGIASAPGSALPATGSNGFPGFFRGRYPVTFLLAFAPRGLLIGFFVSGITDTALLPWRNALSWLMRWGSGGGAC